jgi:hypothetical protein
MNETGCVSIRTSRFSHAHIVCQDLLRGAARLSFTAGVSPSPPTAQRTGSCVGSTAAVERAYSYRAGSGSKEPTQLSVLPLPYFTLRPLPETDDIILVFKPDEPAYNQGKDQEFLPLFVDNRHDRKT